MIYVEAECDLKIRINCDINITRIVLTVRQVRSEKKNMYKIRVFDWGFSPDPHRLFGDFKNPLGQLAVSSGIFKIPSGLRGSG